MGKQYIAHIVNYVQQKVLNHKKFYYKIDLLLWNLWSMEQGISSHFICKFQKISEWWLADFTTSSKKLASYTHLSSLKKKYIYILMYLSYYLLSKILFLLLFSHLPIIKAIHKWWNVLVAEFKEKKCSKDWIANLYL